MANSIQVDALAQLLIEEGIITQEKFFTKAKTSCRLQYQTKGPNDRKNHIRRPDRR